MRRRRGALSSVRILLCHGASGASRRSGAGVMDVAVLPPGNGPDVPGQSVQRPKRHYDSAFRAYAVERAKAANLPLTAVAAELGIPASTLRRWVRAHDVAAAAGSSWASTRQSEPS